MSGEQGERAPGRRREQAEARREQLLHAALEVFSRKGVGESTIKDIARAAGITEGLIYHYFESKSALLAGVIERFAPLPEMTSMLQAVAHVPARTALVRLCRGLLNIYEERREFFTLVVIEIQRNPEVRQILGRVMAGGFEMARQFVADRIERGELRPHDPFVTVRMLQGPLFFYFLMQSRLSPPLPEVDPDQLIDAMVDTVLRGVQADTPETTEEAQG